MLRSASPDDYPKPWLANRLLGYCLAFSAPHLYGNIGKRC